LPLDFEDKKKSNLRPSEAESVYVSVKDNRNTEFGSKIEQHTLGPNLTGVNATKQRRQSYYHESTVHMQSFLEEQQQLIEKLFEQS